MIERRVYIQAVILGIGCLLFAILADLQGREQIKHAWAQCLMVVYMLGLVGDLIQEGMKRDGE